MRELFPDFEGRLLGVLADRVYATGEPQTAQECRVHESYLDLVVEPYRDGAGTVRGVTEHAVDVTAQVEARVAEERRTEEARRRYERARHGIAELQEALLPMALPVLPRARLAARYLVAAEDQ